MAKIADSAKIYKNVTLGKNVVIEDQCIIGIPPVGHTEGELETIIGDNSVLRAQTIVYAGNKIGQNFQTGNKANIRELNEIGNNVSIGTMSVVEHHVKIENNVRIHSQCFVPEFSELKTNCWLGPNVVLTNAKYPKSPEVKNNLQGPIVGEGVIIGANSTILPAINIGREVIIGAGSVVTKDLEDKNVYVGNPAKKIKPISDLPY